MASLVERLFIKLLLVVTLTIQPVALSYAMVGMDHLHQQDSSSMSYQSMEMDETTSAHLAASDAAKSDTLSAECCDNSACSPAIISVVEIKCSVPHRTFTNDYSHSWEAVSPPTEIRPPRL
jgi:hypothetical protein